jgi:hypothetical protein
MRVEYSHKFPEASSKAVEDAVHRSDLYKARIIDQLKFVADNLVHYGAAINQVIRKEAAGLLHLAVWVSNLLM